MLEQDRRLSELANSVRSSADLGYRRSVSGWTVLTRMGCDVLAVAVGLVAYKILAGHVGWIQVGWAAGYVLLAFLIDASHIRREWNTIEECVLAAKVAVAALVLTATAGFLIATMVSRILFFTVTVVMVVSRPVSAWLVGKVRPEQMVRQDLLLVCSDQEYAAILDGIAEQHVASHRIVGRLHGDQLHYDPSPAGGFARSQDGFELIAACDLVRPTRLVLGATGHEDAAFSEAVVVVNERGVTVRSLPRFFEEAYGRVPITTIEASWFLFDIAPLHRLRYRFARRLVDILAGLIFGVGFLLLFPVLLLLVKAASPGPLLYRQRRIGQDGKPFTIVKLRTMPTNAEDTGPQFAAQKDPRVGRIGRFLRATRLDELPQGRNLLSGDMSLVGPRPERPEFVLEFEAEIPFYAKRHLIKPGMTGWAQVHEGYGASLTETSRKLERDLYYLKYQSLSLDLRIMTATISSVLRLSGR